MDCGRLPSVRNPGRQFPWILSLTNAMVVAHSQYTLHTLPYTQYNHVSPMQWLPNIHWPNIQWYHVSQVQWLPRITINTILPYMHYHIYNITMSQQYGRLAPLCNLYLQPLEQPLRVCEPTSVLTHFHFSTFYATRSVRPFSFQSNRMVGSFLLPKAKS